MTHQHVLNAVEGTLQDLRSTLHDVDDDNPLVGTSTASSSEEIVVI
jgi:hypothetical protein